LGLILYRDESIDSRNIDAIVKALDAIADLKVVANGLAWSLGVNPTQIDSIVADANDRKLVGGEVYRRPDGQIGKPPGWVGPEAEIEEVVKRVQAN
jgi:predicted HAD superfamily Cof-like phosphohydrolase